MAETGYYILCTAIFLVILWIFLFKIETGVLLFFAAGLSIQYLEKFVFGSFSALDVAGMVFLFLFFFGLWIGKKNIIYELTKDKSLQVFFGLLLLLFFSGIFLSELFYPAHSQLTFFAKLGVWGKFVNGFIVLVVVSSLFVDKKRVGRLLNCMLLSLVVPGSIALWEIITGNTRIHGAEAYPMPWAFFHHPGVIAFGFIVLFPAALFKHSQAANSKLKVFWGCVIVLMLTLIFLTYRRVVWLGLLAQLVVWCFLLQKGKYKIIYGYLALLLTVLIVGTELAFSFRERLADIYTFLTNIPDVFYDKRYDTLMNGRWGVIRINSQYFVNQPIINAILGNGVGATKYAGAGNHNCYFIILIEFGLISFIMYISLLSLFFVKALRSLSLPDPFLRDFSKLFLTLLISYLFMGLGTHLFYEITSGVWFFWGLAGAFWGIFNDRTNATPIP